jgi:molybdate transport system regulatory protein
MPHHDHSAAPPRRPAGLAAGPRTAGYRVAGRLWIEKGGETWLAWGRIVLLERIRDHGSISAAARSMEMSYRHAWALVESMNALAPAPLVEKATGGRQGGGARLTPAGAAAVDEFWRLVEEFGAWLEARRLRPRRGRGRGPVAPPGGAR